MTDIPGTGKLSNVNQGIPQSGKPLPLTVINVSELVNPNKDSQKDQIWYTKFTTWLLAGSLFSLFFVFLALTVDKTFLVLLPVGPIIGTISWYVKNLAKKFEDKQDRLFKRS